MSNRSIRSLFAIAAPLLLACGRPDSAPTPPGATGCSRCATYQVCSPARDRCVVDRTSRWLFGVIDATLDKPRDVYFRLDGQKSSVKQDTSFPSWSEGKLYQAGVLLDQGATLEFFDSGIFLDTTLSQPRRVLFTEDSFGAAQLRVTVWDKVLEASLLLQPQ